MTSYNALMGYLSQAVPILTQPQRIQVAQQLITYFVQHLPTDWLAQELPNEQPHYETLATLVSTQTWQVAALTQALNALDDIMWQMGDAYPHSTGDYPLQLLVLLDHYLQLVADVDTDAAPTPANRSLAEPQNGQQPQVQAAAMIMLIDEFLGFYEKQVEMQQGHPVQLDHWLDYLPIGHAFAHLKTALEATKIPT